MAAPSRDDELVLLPLGGAGEIGMNFNAYGYGPADEREWIVVDCGVLFGREGLTPGIDLIMPDIRYLAEQRENVRAIVLTHAHEDHIGAVAHLWPQLRCPVYATPFTARLLEDKLEEAGLSEKLRIKIVPLGGKLKLGPFAIEFVSITHSIPEPNALAIRTPLGVVVHTGDWKIDPDPLLGEATDIGALTQAGRRRHSGARLRFHQCAGSRQLRFRSRCSQKPDGADRNVERSRGRDVTSRPMSRASTPSRVRREPMAAKWRWSAARCIASPTLRARRDI